MSGNYIDLAEVAIETLAESKRLFEVLELEVTTTKDTAAVTAMNARRVARGWTRKVKAVEATLKIAQTVEPEVEWEDLLDSDEEFNIFFRRGTRGRKRRLVGCVVDSITEGYAGNGEPTYDVHLMVLDNVRVR